MWSPFGSLALLLSFPWPWPWLQTAEMQGRNTDIKSIFAGDPAFLCPTSDDWHLLHFLFLCIAIIKSQGCAISLESALWLDWTPRESWTPPSSPFKVWVSVSCCTAYLMAAYGESGLTPLLPMPEEGIPRLMSIIGSPNTNTTELAMFSQPHRLFPILEATSPPSPRGEVWLQLLLNSSMCPWLTGLDSATF